MRPTSHLRKTLRLAVPIMLGQVGHIVTTLIDNVMVGQLGTTALAASSLAMSMLIVPVMFGIGLSMGITPLVGAAEGRKNRSETAALFRSGLRAIILAGVVITGITLLPLTFLDHLGQDQPVVDESRSYFLLVGLSLLPVMIFQAYRQFAEGLAMTRMAMAISLFSNVLNIILNYLLIYGHFGFPEWGLMGAGVATLVARIVMALAMACYVQWHTSLRPYRLKVKGADRTRQVLRTGWPIGLQLAFEAGAFGVAGVLVGTLGEAPQAAHQIALALSAFTYMAASGISSSTTIRISFFRGRADEPELRAAGRASYQLVFAMMSLFALSLVLGRHAMPEWFSSDPEVLNHAAILMILAAIFQLSDGVQVVAQGALRGLEDVRMPTLIAFFSYWVIGLPCAAIFGLALDIGAPGIWIGLALGLSTSAIGLSIRFWSRARLPSQDA